MAPSHVVTVMGPTASGKSALAAALAREFDLEIVSVDSAQVYRDMDIGTAKPSTSERAATPHHLLDLVAPTEAYSAARFRTDALAAIAAIHARGRLPLLVGGTMLYFKALRDGLSALPQADPEIRAQLDREAATLGWPAMHAELARVDATTAARLAPNDSQRIQRALEVYRASGVSMSMLLNVEQAVDPLPFTLTQIALVPADRATLHARIAERFDAMLAGGLIEEVQALRECYTLDPELPSMRAVGYRQVWAYLDGDGDRAALRERGIAATRQLAKRQLTWLRSWADVTTLDPFASDPFDPVRALVSALR